MLTKGEGITLDLRRAVVVQKRRVYHKCILNVIANCETRFWFWDWLLLLEQS